MKIFPDFTWEWIVEHCEQSCRDIQERTDPQDLSEPNWVLDRKRGIIAIVAKLRAHPQIEKLVPMMSLWHLRWFPSDGYEIRLEYEQDRIHYRITICWVNYSSVMPWETIEQKLVTPDRVADEIYAYIVELNRE
jgi:hypothetical protein